MCCAPLCTRILSRLRPKSLDSVLVLLNKSYFYIHVLYYLFISFISAAIIFGIEKNRIGIQFIDSLFLSISSFTLTGLITFDISKMTNGSLFIYILLMYYGGLIFTSLPLLLLRTLVVYKKYDTERQEKKRRKKHDVEVQQFRASEAARELEEAVAKAARGEDSAATKKTDSPVITVSPKIRHSLDVVVASSSSNSTSRDYENQNMLRTVGRSLPIEIEPVSATTASPSAPGERIQFTNSGGETVVIDLIAPGVTFVEEKDDGADSDNEKENMEKGKQPQTVVTSAQKEPTPAEEESSDDDSDTSESAGVDKSAAKFWRKNFKDLQFGDYDWDDFEQPSEIPKMPQVHLEKKLSKNKMVNRSLNTAVAFYKEQLDMELPTIAEIEFWAHFIILISVILLFHIMLILFFIIIGSYLHAVINSATIEHRNPWFVSLFLTISAFNNVGMVPFAQKLVPFQSDAFLQVNLMILTLLGNVLFPFVFRLLMLLCYRAGSKRNKIIFKYILVNHHHLTTLLYPSVQTRIYTLVSVLLIVFGTLGSYLLERTNSVLNSELHPHFTVLNFPLKVLLFLFHIVSTRSAGFQTFDISEFSFATLCIFLVMMRIKPQLYCSLDEQAYQIVQLQNSIDKTQTDTKSITKLATIIQEKLPLEETKGRKVRFFSDDENEDTQSTLSPAEEKGTQGLVSAVTVNAHQPAVEVHEQPAVPQDAVPPATFGSRQHLHNLYKHYSGNLHKFVQSIRYGENFFDRSAVEVFKEKFVMVFRTLFHHTSNLIFKNNVWIVMIMFGIVAFDLEKLSPSLINMDKDYNQLEDDKNPFSIFKIIFEVISAFACCGLSLGSLPPITPQTVTLAQPTPATTPPPLLSFSALLSVPSKLFICFLMIIGRHRGLSNSVRDQRFIHLTAEQVRALLFERYVNSYSKKEKKRLKKLNKQTAKKGIASTQKQQ